MRKIAVFTGSRAEYGILKPILTAIRERNDLELDIIVTGMHLLDKFGQTYREIEKDGFKISEKIPCISEDDDTKERETLGISKVIEGSVGALNRIKPDITFVPCDRSEMMGAAIAAYYLGLPIAHIHGGEKSNTKDDSTRHVITKLAHIHFPSTEKSAERIKKLGEKEEHIFNVGAAGMDTILNKPLMNLKELKEKTGINFETPTLLVVQHPFNSENSESEITETLEAIKELKMQTIIIYPNSDAGGRRIIDKIKEYEQFPYIRTFTSLDHTTYLSLLKHCKVMVGNSSSAIIEAPAFGLPVINIGNREEGREKAASTIDVAHKKEEIINAIKKGLSPEFREEISKCKSPYGNGTAGKQIAEILANIEINEDLLQKKITY